MRVHAEERHHVRVAHAAERVHLTHCIGWKLAHVAYADPLERDLGAGAVPRTKYCSKGALAHLAEDPIVARAGGIASHHIHTKPIVVFERECNFFRNSSFSAIGLDLIGFAST